jgi:hypothetical protein
MSSSKKRQKKQEKNILNQDQEINLFNNLISPKTGVGNCFGSGATLWKRRLAEGRTF